MSRGNLANKIADKISSRFIKCTTIVVTDLMPFQGARTSTFVMDELTFIPKIVNVDVSLSDEKKLKVLTREYSIAKVRRDKKRMSYLEKEIRAIRGE